MNCKKVMHLISRPLAFLTVLFISALGGQPVAQPNPSEIELVSGFHYQGIDGTVEKTALHNGDLYISGDFEFIGDQPFSRLARWDGSSWNAVGNDLLMPVYGFTEFQNSLYAHGVLETDGYSPGQSRTFGRITPEGIEMIPLPEGTQPGYGMLVHEELLYVLLVTSGGGWPLSALYTWDGENWDQKSDDFPGVPRWMTFVDETLYVANRGPLMDPENPDNTSALAKFSPDLQQLTLVDTPHSFITNIGTFDGSLFTVGSTVFEDGSSANIFRKVNGSFSPVSVSNNFGLSISVNRSELITFDDTFYLTGEFRHTGQDEQHQLLKFNPSSAQFVQAQSHGTPSSIPFIHYTATADAESLILGGNFLANDLETRNLIRLDTNLQTEAVFEPQDGMPLANRRWFYRTNNSIFFQSSTHAAFLADGSHTHMLDLQDLQPKPFPYRPLRSHVAEEVTYFMANTNDGTSLFELDDDGYSVIVPNMAFNPNKITGKPGQPPLAIRSVDEHGTYKVYQLNGTSWQQIGNDLLADPLGYSPTLHLHDGMAIVSRFLPEEPDENDAAILSYDLSQGNSGDWVPFRDIRLTGNIHDFVFDEDGNMYMAGEFYDENENSNIYHVGKISSEGILTDITNGLNATAKKLTLWNGLLITLGEFTENTETGEPLHTIAGFHEGNWVQILEGYTPDELSAIQQLYTFGNSIYITGNFNTLGSYVSSGIAKLVHPDLIPPVSTEPELVPIRISLSQNYPNPFNPTTQISYVLPEATNVRLEVFDITGRRVMQLQDGMQQAGNHTIIFDGSRLSSGVYIYRLRAGDSTLNRAMTLLK